MTSVILVIITALLVPHDGIRSSCQSLRKKSSVNDISAGLLVQTDQGWIQGHINGGNVREWTGIPYAVPPVGTLRWTDPVSPLPDQSGGNCYIYQASFNAPGCSQICTLPPGTCPVTVSEDCLYLSIWAPLNQSSFHPEGYPVIFWIHGGTFTQGLGNTPLYNGTNFAIKNVITVVINYRLGAFGFLASKSMTGNYGIKDQRLALQWTKRNIAVFGGNPNNITIAGQR